MAQVVNEPDPAATYGIQPYMFEPDSEPELESEDVESMEASIRRVHSPCLPRRQSFHIHDYQRISVIKMCMWILLVIWILLFVNGKVINECRLFLQTLATATCQLYLALLPLRHAAQYFAKAAWNILIEPCISVNDDERRLSYCCPCLRKATVHYLEGVCLLWESLSQLLAVVSSVCVAVRHVLQGALFLVVSTARWLQQRMLCKGDVDEWVKEQNQQRERIEKQRRQVEEYLHAVDPLTGKGSKKGGKRLTIS